MYTRKHEEENKENNERKKEKKDKEHRERGWLQRPTSNIFIIKLSVFYNKLIDRYL